MARSRLKSGGMLTKEFEFIRYNGDKLVLANARHCHTRIYQSINLYTFEPIQHIQIQFKTIPDSNFFFLQKTKKKGIGKGKREK